MHGIKEIINYNARNQEAQRIIEARRNDVDTDALIRQEALNNYLKNKYPTQGTNNG